MALSEIKTIKNQNKVSLPSINKEKTYNQVKENYNEFFKKENPYLLKKQTNKINRWNVYDKISTRINLQKRFKELNQLWLNFNF